MAWLKIDFRKGFNVNRRSFMQATYGSSPGWQTYEDTEANRRTHKPVYFCFALNPWAGLAGSRIIQCAVGGGLVRSFFSGVFIARQEKCAAVLLLPEKTDW